MKLEIYFQVTISFYSSFPHLFLSLTLHTKFLAKYLYLTHPSKNEYLQISKDVSVLRNKLISTVFLLCLDVSQLLYVAPSDFWYIHHGFAHVSGFDTVLPSTNSSKSASSTQNHSSLS